MHAHRSLRYLCMTSTQTRYVSTAATHDPPQTTIGITAAKTQQNKGTLTFWRYATMLKLILFLIPLHISKSVCVTLWFFCQQTASQLHSASTESLWNPSNQDEVRLQATELQGSAMQTFPQQIPLFRITQCNHKRARRWNHDEHKGNGGEFDFEFCLSPQRERLRVKAYQLGKLLFFVDLCTISTSPCPIFLQ